DLVASMSFFFFFQAEDGIRDKLVTGVQTCALPISVQQYGDGERRDQLDRDREGHELHRRHDRVDEVRILGQQPPVVAQAHPVRRSEERRVGKECRSRWAADQYKKKRSSEMN